MTPISRLDPAPGPKAARAQGPCTAQVSRDPERFVDPADAGLCRALWLAVIRQAVEDGDTVWVDSQSFAPVCRLAGLEPEWARRKIAAQMAANAGAYERTAERNRELVRAARALKLATLPPEIAAARLEARRLRERALAAREKASSITA